jgi:peroxiredoxin Q/BCP
MTKAKTVMEGDIAPDFTLATDGAGKFTLSKNRGVPVVIYFYPKDDTAGCTREAIEFSARAGDFAEVETLVVGVSPDDEKSHERFKKKHGLSIKLAADTGKTAANAYGVWVEKSMYGRKYMGVERSTFLIDRNGVIAKAWRNVKVPGHVDEVLDAARMIGGTAG